MDTCDVHLYKSITHSIITAAEPNYCFLFVLLGTSAWRSFHALIGWSITALPSWWLPQDCLWISAMCVRTHDLMPRCGNNDGHTHASGCSACLKWMFLSNKKFGSWKYTFLEWTQTRVSRSPLFTGGSGVRISHKISVMCTHLEPDSSDNW